MSMFKKVVRGSLRTMGFDIVRYPPPFAHPPTSDGLGVDPFRDIQFFLRKKEAPLILDIGANEGQTVDAFKEYFPKARIHSFEPSPQTFDKLRHKCELLEDVVTWNLGVGSCQSQLPFHENSYSNMSSFLEPDEFAWGRVVKTIHVDVVTVDQFAMDNQIEFVDLLKSDTQGFDYEVVLGATDLMKQNRIGLVYFEFIFSKMYQNLPSFDKMVKLLLDNNFLLVSLYHFHYQDNLASWADVLFVHKQFHIERFPKDTTSD